MQLKICNFVFVIFDLLKRFGLIGYPLKHSLSEKYFLEKFDKEHINNATYELFPLKNLLSFEQFIRLSPDLVGLNVTIPYKEKIIPFLQEIDETAVKIGAVNCIKVFNIKQNQTYLKGYNTDITGFEQSLLPLLKPYYKKALILGKGGSAKAVTYILDKLNISYLIVTQTPNNSNQISYNEINDEDQHFRDEFKMRLYIGASRARFLLFICKYNYIDKDYFESLD